MPGGGFTESRECLADKLIQQYPWLVKDLALRYVHQFGTLAWVLISENVDLGEYFGARLYQVEVDYLKKYEFVLSVGDLLWRHTKLALFLSEKELQKLKKYFKNSLV